MYFLIKVESYNNITLDKPQENKKLSRLPVTLYLNNPVNYIWKAYIFHGIGIKRKRGFK